MLHFDPQNPYPLLLPGVASYSEDQAHAAAVDHWLGLETGRIEAELAGHARRADQQLWIGLPVQAMLTPYTEFRAILDRLGPLPGQIIVDLGAGYGRMGFVIARHHPEVRFMGYEYVSERVRAGQDRLAASGAPGEIRLIEADLAAPDFSPVAADFYFLYDYGTGDAIEKTLEDLRRIALTRPITVVGRGRASRDRIERGQPWLSQVHPPEHCGHYSIYRS